MQFHVFPRDLPLGVHKTAVKVQIPYTLEAHGTTITCTISTQQYPPCLTAKNLGGCHVRKYHFKTTTHYSIIKSAVTVVSRKSTHGQTMLQSGGLSLFRMFPHLTTKDNPCHVYNNSTKPRIRQAITYNRVTSSLEVNS